MKQPLTDEIVPLGDCLNMNVTWRETKDPMALWRAEVGSQKVGAFALTISRKRICLYTLLINDQEIGHFDDWPPHWVRAGQQSDESSVKTSSVKHSERNQTP